MRVLDIFILIVGIVLIVLGLIIWIKHNASLTLDYSVGKVKEKDIKKFTTSYGITYIIMGFFMILMSLIGVALGDSNKWKIVIFYFVGYFVFMKVINRIQKKYSGVNNK